MRGGVAREDVAAPGPVLPPEAPAPELDDPEGPEVRAREEEDEAGDKEDWLPARSLRGLTLPPTGKGSCTGNVQRRGNPREGEFLDTPGP